MWQYLKELDPDFAERAIVFVKGVSPSLQALIEFSHSTPATMRIMALRSCRE